MWCTWSSLICNGYGSEILKELNLNENVRAEELSIKDFADIARVITEKKN